MVRRPAAPRVALLRTARLDDLAGLDAQHRQNGRRARRHVLERSRHLELLADVLVEGGGGGPACAPSPTTGGAPGLSAPGVPVGAGGAVRRQPVSVTRFAVWSGAVFGGNGAVVGGGVCGADVAGPSVPGACGGAFGDELDCAARATVAMVITAAHTADKVRVRMLDLRRRAACNERATRLAPSTGDVPAGARAAGGRSSHRAVCVAYTTRVSNRAPAHRA